MHCELLSMITRSKKFTDPPDIVVIKDICIYTHADSMCFMFNKIFKFSLKTIASIIIASLVY